MDAALSSTSVRVKGLKPGEFSVIGTPRMATTIIRCAIASILVLLGSPLLDSQTLVGTRSHRSPQKWQGAMSQTAAQQHVLSEARTSFWGITIGAALPELPDCALDPSMPENSSVCLSRSLPPRPPYSYMTISNAPYRSAQLRLILHKDVVESVDSVIDGPWCGRVLRSLQNELGESSMYRSGSRRRERTWMWHTSPNIWVFYSMDLNGNDGCILAALTDIGNWAAIPDP